MNTTEHLLVCTMEECNEVSQRISKILRFGINEIQPGQNLSNQERLRLELIDLFSILAMLPESIINFNEIPSDEEFEKKKAKVMKYMEYSKQQGTLNE